MAGASVRQERHGTGIDLSVFQSLPALIPSEFADPPYSAVVYNQRVPASNHS